MRLRLTLRLLRVGLHILQGLFTCAFVFPWIRPVRRAGHIQRWSRGVLHLFGVAVEELVLAPMLSNALLVANHVSWLDVFVINAHFPSRFVAKSEVRAWPLIGRLSAMAGTIFVARGQPSELRRTIGTMAGGLRAGERIACFPEGTSAAQGAMLPFRANLFEASVGTAIPVQPLALIYLDREGARHPAVDYIGDMSLGQSMIAILSGNPICARLVTLPALAPASLDRRALAASAHAQVRHVLSQHLPTASMMAQGPK